MAAKASDSPTSASERLQTVTPRLVVSDGAAAIDFYQRAFAAEQLGEPFFGPNGELIHGEIRIGGSVIMLTEDSDLASTAPAKSPQALGGFVSAIMSVRWDDVDACMG